jgi:hypothetical protein
VYFAKHTDDMLDCVGEQCVNDCLICVSHATGADRRGSADLTRYDDDIDN